MELIAACVFDMKLDASAEENERFMQNAISAFNPAVNKSQPMFTSEQVDKIVTAQVRSFFKADSSNLT